MALSTMIVCHECGKEKSVIHSAGIAPLICSDCKAKKFNEKKREALGVLSKLPLEERVRRIEEWIFDHENRNPDLHSFKPLVFG